MIPQKLTITAFGPFATTQEIDFTLLGHAPLFLINGPTGAGKSSILDALCFALYGQTTGNDRDATQMRCDHASDDTLTIVTLAFNLGSKKYLISRTPTQYKMKTRGNGTTKHQTECQLWRISGAENEKEELIVAKSSSEATSQIETMTGLNVEQFRQVMVLPQGKFRDFLMSDSSKREEIFSKLFQTQIYKKMEFALKDKALSISREINNAKNQQIGILKAVDIANLQQLELEIKKLVAPLEAALAAKTLAQNELLAQQNILAKAQAVENSYIKLEQNQTALALKLKEDQAFKLKKEKLKWAKQAELIQHVKQDLINLQAEKTSIQKALDYTLDKLKKVSLELKVTSATKETTDLSLTQLDKLKAEKNILNGMMNKMTTLEIAQVKAEAVDVQFKKITTLLKQEESQLKEIKKNISHDQNRIAEFTILTKKIPQLKQDLILLEELGVKRHQYDQDQAKISKLNTLYTKNQNSINAQLEKIATLNLSIKEIEMLWHQDQAADLALALKKDIPCSVCGGLAHNGPLHHYQKQSKGHQIIDRKQIENKKQDLAQIENILIENKIQNAKLETQIIELNKTLVFEQERLGEHIKKSTSQLREDWGQLKSDYDRLIKNEQNLRQYEVDYNKLLKQLNIHELAFDNTRVIHQNKKEQDALAKQHISHLEQEIPIEFRTKNSLKLKIGGLTHQILEIQKSSDQANKNFTQQTAKMNQTTTELAEQNKQSDAIVIKFNQGQKSWEAALANNHFKDEKEFQSARLKSSEQENIANTIEDYDKIIVGLNSSIADLKSILQDSSRPKIKQLQTQLDLNAKEYNQQDAQWNNLSNRQSGLLNVQKKLMKFQQQNSLLDQQYKIYGTLSDVANGQTGNRISLQRFVLSVLLDDVLLEASLRLQKMSKGRYTLIRMEDKSKGKKASGLELEVEDSYTGKSRSVATLSGGESFMAALALALGLSDIVQAYAGGIKLDTLFIDEGFGSLDQDSLDLAINTLCELRSSGRMVGIISHVSELKDRMSSRIDVLNNQNGSSIKVVSSFH